MRHQGSLGYVAALDGLRAIAVMFVVGAYIVGVPPGGAVGVDIFFVLSGFLITTLLLEEHSAASTVNLAAFYVRRVRRLYPALAVLLVVYSMISLARGGHPFALVGLGASYVANIVSATQHMLLVNSPIGMLWSLSEEE